MKLKRLGRGGEQVSREQTKALLAHVHLRELVGKPSDPRRLIHRTLPKSRRIDVLRLLRCAPVVRRLCCRLASDLLLRELALRRETGCEELGWGSGLARNGGICGPYGGGRHCVRAVIRLGLACCILPTFCVMRSLRRRGCARRWVQSRGHALGIGVRRFPLRPSRSGF